MNHKVGTRVLYRHTRRYKMRNDRCAEWDGNILARDIVISQDDPRAAVRLLRPISLYIARLSFVTFYSTFWHSLMRTYRYRISRGDRKIVVQVLFSDWISDKKKNLKSWSQGKQRDKYMRSERKFSRTKDIFFCATVRHEVLSYINLNKTNIHI